MSAGGDSSLAQLAALRSQRENRAAAELSASRRALAQAHASQVVAERQRDDFPKQRKVREEQLFAALQKTRVQRRELDDYGLEIEKLDQRQTTLIAAVEAAAEAAAKAAKAVEQAQQAWCEAARNRQKLTLFIEREQVVAALATERAEERELEEFAHLARRSSV